MVSLCQLTSNVFVFVTLAVVLGFLILLSCTLLDLLADCPPSVFVEVLVAYAHGAVLITTPHFSDSCPVSMSLLLSCCPSEGMFQSLAQYVVLYIFFFGLANVSPSF